MSGASCVRCTRPMPDVAYCCPLCVSQAAENLSRVTEYTQAARDVAQGQSRRSGGGGSGKPGSRLPFDLAATAKLDAVENALGGWLRHVGEERGTTATTVMIPMPDEDPIIVICERLMQHLDWLRFRPEVDEFLTDVEAAVRVLRGLARGPAEQAFLGPCGAWTQTSEHPVDAEGLRTGGTLDSCEGDVYGRAGAASGRCKTCGAEYDQGERRVWLDDVRREHLYYASEIADAYPIKVMTIRAWLSRGLLVAHGEHEGRPLLKLGEVLDLAAGDAARREEARAARARRAAAKAAESEEAA